MPEIQLAQGTIHYRDQGSGDPPVVFIHGVLVDGRVWHRVVDSLASRRRCVVPDLPLGAHTAPMDVQADLSPPGLAQLVADLLERLELNDVTLVGNDTGGAICQLVAAHHPDRIGRLVLTNCDAFDHFPPPKIRLAVRGLARIPGAVAALALLGRLRPMRNATMSIAPLTVEPVADELLKSWLEPLHRRQIRRDLVRVLQGVSPDHTLKAAELLKAFDRPALIIWGSRDRFFPLEDGHRLADLLPKGRIEQIENARTFVQLDAPERVAELVESFGSTPALAKK
jgi:pimeloyl-ACP methyl ester carboxylesterase